MKILEVLDEMTASGTLYVGNEFSPDPLDMLQRIQAINTASTNKETFSRELEVRCSKDREQYETVSADIKSLLTKNGYVEYNPSVVVIIPTFMRGYDE